MIQKPKCESNDVTTNRTSSESHLRWKYHFRKNPLYLKIYADFEAGREQDNSNIGNKATNNYKQNPVLIIYDIISELDDVLETGYYKSASVMLMLIGLLMRM